MYKVVTLFTTLPSIYILQQVINTFIDTLVHRNIVGLENEKGESVEKQKDNFHKLKDSSLKIFNT